MERLTRAKEWADSIDLKKELGYKHIWNRLLEYEKTDLTPQEIEELKQKEIPKKIYRHKWIGIDGVPYDLCPNCKTNYYLLMDMLEEIADVEIMTAQLKLLLNAESDVEEIKKAKIQRQLDRIEQEVENKC